jgi:hypothetical protein
VTDGYNLFSQPRAPTRGVVEGGTEVVGSTQPGLQSGERQFVPPIGRWNMETCGPTG